MSLLKAASIRRIRRSAASVSTPLPRQLGRRRKLKRRAQRPLRALSSGYSRIIPCLLFAVAKR